jgi:hypothetical protein
MGKTLVTRAHICERLRLKRKQCWQMFPTEVGNRVWDSTVVNCLRNKAVNVRNVSDFIPSDLLTPEEIAKEIGTPARWVLNQIKNVRKAVPHYRLGLRTILVRRSEFLTWCATANKTKRAV